MASRSARDRRGPGLGAFEHYLTLWVLLCIGVGILLGKGAPGAARYLDSLAIHVGGAPVVSVPIAVALFLMMYPIMVKIDFGEVVRAGKNTKPVLLTLIVNWGSSRSQCSGSRPCSWGLCSAGSFPAWRS